MKESSICFIKKFLVLVIFTFCSSNIFALGHQITFEQKAATDFKSFRYEGDLTYYFSIINEPYLSFINGGRFLSIYANAAYTMDFTKTSFTPNARFDLGLDLWFMPIFGIFTNRFGVFYSPTTQINDRFGIFYDLNVCFDFSKPIYDSFWGEYSYCWDNNFSFGLKSGVRFDFYPMNKGRHHDITLYLGATVTFNFKSKGSFWTEDYPAVGTNQESSDENLSEENLH